MKLGMLVVLFALVGCGHEPQHVVDSSNPEIKVDVLFDVDGCRMYRFSDAGRLIYFDHCGNVDSRVTWQVTQGKSQVPMSVETTQEEYHASHHESDARELVHLPFPDAGATAKVSSHPPSWFESRGDNLR